MSAQHKLNQHLILWNKVLLEEWAVALEEEAKTKADFEYAFSIFKVTERMNDTKVASAWADSLAHADEEVARLNLKRRIAEATVEAVRKKLSWFEATADSIRSEVSSEREEAKLHSQNRYVP